MQFTQLPMTPLLFCCKILAISGSYLHKMKMIDQLIHHGMTNKLFTNEDLKRLLMGTPASRYALINKALKKGEIVQLRRGIYVMGRKYAHDPFSQFNIASQMIPHKLRY